MNRENNQWIDNISDEDISFIKRFILASGSLKLLAKEYGITYPTIRLRLDRLITKISVLISNEKMSDFERILRSKYAEEKLDGETFKQLLDSFKKEQEK